MRRKRKLQVPKTEAQRLLDEAVKLLNEPFGHYGNWTTPSYWNERRVLFLRDVENAKIKEQ